VRLASDRALAERLGAAAPPFAARFESSPGEYARRVADLVETTLQ
jgi:hypothetical protein